MDERRLHLVDDKAELPQELEAPVVPVPQAPRVSLRGLETASDATKSAVAAATIASTGALVGLLASGEVRGALVGAGANLALLGLTAAALGGGRVPQQGRILYGVLGCACATFVGYLVVTRQ
jgi:hypothetical protein